jgi:hypothetical protein
MPVRFPRVIFPQGKIPRLVGPQASPGEWAVTGSFRYAHRDPASLLGREAPAFGTSWLGIGSFAPALQVEIAEIAAAEIDQVARMLAAHLLDAWEVPTPELAVELAREEIGFALALAEHPAGTILALRREFGEQGLMERTRIVAEPRTGR